MPVTAQKTAERERRHAARIAKALPHIPEGPYCYSAQDRCPYHKLRSDKQEQQSGYCRLLKNGDWQRREIGGTMLLWDSVKECGLKDAEPLDADSEDPRDD